MPRRPRVTLPGAPLHAIQRGNNRQHCFFSERDRMVYLGGLERSSKLCDCELHAYVLMTNHVHLLLTPRSADGAALMMKRLGQGYVQYVNRVHTRSGSLWEGRYRSCLVQEEAYLMACYRYIELNPVRAGLAAEPAGYPWSSFRANALGEADPLVTPHALYRALGETPEARREAHRALFPQPLPPDLVDAIRSATNGNFALGDDPFRERVAARLGWRVTSGKRGRPNKNGV